MEPSNERDAEEHAFLKIDKAYTPFLFKAIEAVQRTNWVDSYDLNRVHISMRKDRYQGRDCIVVRFYAADLTNVNWMEVTSADIGGAHVYMEAAGRAVLHIAIEH